MLSANVKSANNDIIRDDQLGVIQQVLKVIKLPFVFVRSIVINWQFVINEGDRVP